jgi:hypothetical protein
MSFFIKLFARLYFGSPGKQVKFIAQGVKQALEIPLGRKLRQKARLHAFRAGHCATVTLIRERSKDAFCRTLIATLPL